MSKSEVSKGKESLIRGKRIRQIDVHIKELKNELIKAKAQQKKCGKITSSEENQILEIQRIRKEFKKLKRERKKLLEKELASRNVLQETTKIFVETQNRLEKLKEKRFSDVVELKEYINNIIKIFLMRGQSFLKMKK